VRDLSDLASELSIVSEEKEKENDDSDSDGVFEEEGAAGKAGRKRRFVNAPLLRRLWALFNLKADLLYRHAPAAKSQDTKPRKRSARPPREDSVFDDVSSR